MKSPVLFELVCGPQFKFSNDVGYPSPFVMSLSARLSMSPFIQKIFAISLEVVEKPNKCKSFSVPNFFARDDPDFSTADR